MEYDDSFEKWEMKVDPYTLFPLCTEKMSSSSSSSLKVKITANHQITETSSITPSFSEASLSPFSYLDGNLHVGDDVEKILPTRKNNWTDYKIDATVNEGQSEGDKWLRSRSKKTALPLPKHIAVERKRRRELNQRFLALSKVVPGNYKKKDRASILGEAVKYMTDLQERIKKLEEMKQKKVVESVVFVKKTSSSSSSPLPSSSMNQYDSRSHNRNNNVEGDDYYYNYCNPSYERRRGVLLRGVEEEEEIEAKVIERNVLIRVHCGNYHNHHHQEILATLLSPTSELHLTVLTANALPFGNHIDITVIAQMGVNFCMKTKDIVNHLRLALPNFI